MIVGQMWPHVITIHIWDCLGIPLGLPRDYHEIVNGLPRDCRAIGLGFARDRGIAVGLPWGCLPIACFEIGEGLGLPNGCLGIAGFPMDCFGIV